MESIKLLDVSLMDDLGDVKFAHDFFILLLECLLDEILVVILDTSLLVDFLNCDSTFKKSLKNMR